jgi:3-mercaptopyruvate sulfurtransferase SseA
MRFNFMMIAVLLFGLGVLTACQNTAESVKVEKAQTNTVQTNTVTKPQTDEHAHEDDAPRITLAEAKKEFDAGNAVFVDTRAENTYNNEHIKGAVNVPMEAFEAKYKNIPTGKKIIVYCS